MTKRFSKRNLCGWLDDFHKAWEAEVNKKYDEYYHIVQVWEIGEIVKQKIKNIIMGKEAR